MKLSLSILKDENDGDNVESVRDVRESQMI